MSFYRFCQYLVRTVAPLFGGLEVRGKENVPTSGPFFLLANHQSTLDPVLIQTACPRPIHTMAKSTQFTNKPLAQIMFLLHSYPVRRYQVDPQAVRYTLRIIERGEPVGIYIEGERTWDGRLQEPRPGTARLILKAGAPVVPCTIDGSFDAWPRWDSKPQSEYRPTEYLQAWVKFWFDDDLRLEAAKALQKARLRRIQQEWTNRGLHDAGLSVDTQRL